MNIPTLHRYPPNANKFEMIVKENSLLICKLQDEVRDLKASLEANHESIMIDRQFSRPCI